MIRPPHVGHSQLRSSRSRRIAHRNHGAYCRPDFPGIDRQLPGLPRPEGRHEIARNADANLGQCEFLQIQDHQPGHNRITFVQTAPDDDGIVRRMQYRLIDIHLHTVDLGPGRGYSRARGIGGIQRHIQFLVRDTVEVGGFDVPFQRPFGILFSRKRLVEHRCGFRQPRFQTRRVSGVSKQTVYSHFQSKDDLFRSCITGKTRSYGLDASQLDESTPLDDGLRYLGRQSLTLLCDKGVIRMFRLMIAEADSFPNLVKSFHESGPGATANLVAELIASHLPARKKNAALSTQIANEFLALVRGDYFLDLLLGRRKSIPAAEIRTHVQHCVAQIRTLYPLDDAALRKSR